MKGWTPFSKSGSQSFETQRQRGARHMTVERRIKIRVGETRGDPKTPRDIVARPGTNLWFQLRKHGIPIGSSCSGVGVCGACAVQVRPLEAADAADTTGPALSEETPFEHDTKARHGIASQKRLACLVRLWGDVVVEDLKNL